MLTAAPLQTGMEPFPGYRLRSLLGRGSFAEVWKAETSDGRPIALKFLACEMGKSTPTEIRSIQAIRQLEHGNLTRIERVWCHLGYIIVAMELAEGSLTDLYEAHEAEEHKPLPMEHTCFFLAQAADALDFLNTRRHKIDGNSVWVQHCDVKPSNMLMFGDTIKLCDFGISTQMTASLMTRKPAGTPEYAAPEVFRGRLSNRTDQYALAVSYCQIRGGRFPFKDTPPNLTPTYTRPLPDLSMLPAKEQPIVGRALAAMPQDRWPTSCEFIDRLATLIA